jgi:hypothetical protein
VNPAVRAEFFRPDSLDQTVGWATWNGSRVEIQAEVEDVRAVLGRIFRPTSVSVDDPASRTAGTTGPVVLTPGSLRWFQAAARARSEAEGLAVRLVPEEGEGMGWDPAGAYRTFGEALERRQRATPSNRLEADRG